ncbi:FkbM family methyltransferase [Ochrobactrum sp. WV_118_8]
MSFLSYAQNLEDVMLWKALKHVEKGFYIDVGANDPVIDSVTKSFYDLGWRGINIEPVRQYYLQLTTHRPEDINLNCAVSDVTGSLAIWECDVRGWATMDKTVAEAHDREGHIGQWHEVDVRTLTDISDQYPSKDIHFLKVDVEGLELSVLKGNNWGVYRPWIVVVEATFPNTQIEMHTDIEQFLLEKRYIFAYADGLNRYYVAGEHKELLEGFKYPPNVFDDYQTISEANAVKERNLIQNKFDKFKKKAKEKERLYSKIINVETMQQKQLFDSALSKIQAENMKVQEALVAIMDSLEPLKLLDEYHDRGRQIQELTTEVERVHIAYDILSKSYSQANDKIFDLERENLQIQAQLSEIHQSIFWRASAPARSLRRKLNHSRKSVKGIFSLSRIDRYPRLKRVISTTTHKLGIYHFARKIYLRSFEGGRLMALSPVDSKTTTHDLSFLSAEGAPPLTVQELHRRVKAEI